MDLDGGVIHNEGRLKGWAGPEIETFLGPEMATSVASAIWAQKSRVSAMGLRNKHTNGKLRFFSYPPTIKSISPTNKNPKFCWKEIQW
jgi:hypothetical protein